MKKTLNIGSAHRNWCPPNGKFFQLRIFSQTLPFGVGFPGDARFIKFSSTNSTEAHVFRRHFPYPVNNTEIWEGAIWHTLAPNFFGGRKWKHVCIERLYRNLTEENPLQLTCLICEDWHEGWLIRCHFEWASFTWCDLYQRINLHFQATNWACCSSGGRRSTSTKCEL